MTMNKAKLPRWSYLPLSILFWVGVWWLLAVIFNKELLLPTPVAVIKTLGALMLTVMATKVESAITEQGGTVDIHYNIEIEDTNAGTVEYHIEVNPIV